MIKINDNTYDSYQLLKQSPCPEIFYQKTYLHVGELSKHCKIDVIYGKKLFIQFDDSKLAIYLFNNGKLKLINDNQVTTNKYMGLKRDKMRGGNESRMYLNNDEFIQLSPDLRGHMQTFYVIAMDFHDLNEYQRIIFNTDRDYRYVYLKTAPFIIPSDLNKTKVILFQKSRKII